MPDSGLLGLSLVCLVVGAGFILFPHPLLALSQALNRTFTTLDTVLVRHRYLSGLVLFVASYLCFRLALLVPFLRG
jgi:hypothetical protein